MIRFAFCLQVLDELQEEAAAIADADAPGDDGSGDDDDDDDEGHHSESDLGEDGESDADGAVDDGYVGLLEEKSDDSDVDTLDAETLVLGGKSSDGEDEEKVDKSPLTPKDLGMDSDELTTTDEPGSPFWESSTKYSKSRVGSAGLKMDMKKLREKEVKEEVNESSGSNGDRSRVSLAHVPPMPLDEMDFITPPKRKATTPLDSSRTKGLKISSSTMVDGKAMKSKENEPCVKKVQEVKTELDNEDESATCFGEGVVL